MAHEEVRIKERVQDGPTLGPVEGLKTAVVTSIQNALEVQLKDYPENDPLHKLSGNITMEYPLHEGEWPAMWIGFSFRKLTDTSINDIRYHGTVGNESEYKLWNFEGNASVTILALSSLERDRISDSFIRMFAFHDLHGSNNIFWSSMESQPYTMLHSAKSELKPMGQTDGPGIAVPWDSSLLGYADSYSFDLNGQFASNVYSGKLVRLSDILIQEEMHVAKTGEWI